MTRSLCKPSELAFYIFLHKNLITQHSIDITKPRVRGISNSTIGDSDQS